MIISPRICSTRTKLQDVIPLDTPYTLFIDLSSRCNFRCNFCPTKKSPSIMSWSTYCKIIDDCKQFPHKIKVLRLYKDGEPLLNPHFTKMIRYAKNANIAESIDTTTNASLLYPELSNRIINAGLDRINISINGLSDIDYKTFTGASINFDQLVRNITYLYKIRQQCHVHVKICDTGNLDKELFYKIFGPISDSCYIENVAPCWPNFDMPLAASEKGIYAQDLTTSVQVCPYIFYSMSINSNGLVSLCFLDWEQKAIIGDCTKDSIVDIWKSKALQSYQSTHLYGNRHTISICKNCQQLIYGQPDNIDNYIEQIKEKI